MVVAVIVAPLSDRALDTASDTAEPSSSPEDVASWLEVLTTVPVLSALLSRNVLCSVVTVPTEALAVSAATAVLPASPLLCEALLTSLVTSACEWELTEAVLAAVTAAAAVAES